MNKTGRRSIRPKTEQKTFKDAFQTTNIVPINGFAKGEEEEAESVLTLTYWFEGETEPYVVRYLDTSINNYALEKDGITCVTVSKDECVQMLEKWDSLLED